MRETELIKLINLLKFKIWNNNYNPLDATNASKCSLIDHIQVLHSIIYGYIMELFGIDFDWNCS